MDSFNQTHSTLLNCFHMSFSLSTSLKLSFPCTQAFSVLSSEALCPFEFGILCPAGLEVGDLVQLPQPLFITKRQPLSSCLSLSFSPSTLWSEHITVWHLGDASLGNSSLVHPSAVWMPVESTHEVILLSMCENVWVCMHGGFLLICCLLCCVPALLPPSPPPPFHLLPPPARRSGKKGLHLSWQE